MINLSICIYHTGSKTANRSQGKGENMQQQSTTYWALTHWEEALKWRKTAAVVLSCSCPYMANTEIVTQQHVQSTVVHILQTLTWTFANFFPIINGQLPCHINLQMRYLPLNLPKDVAFLVMQTFASAIIVVLLFLFLHQAKHFYISNKWLQSVS